MLLLSHTKEFCFLINPLLQEAAINNKAETSGIQLLDIVAIIISLFSLTASIVTLYRNHLDRGHLTMTKPSIVSFGFEKNTDIPKISFTGHLSSTGPKGHVIETIFLKLKYIGDNQEIIQTFKTWNYGQIEESELGSGLYIGKEGKTSIHHFLLPIDGSTFEFLKGEYIVEAYAALLNYKKPIKIFSSQFSISSFQSEKLRGEFSSLIYQWDADNRRYDPYVQPNQTQKQLYNLGDAPYIFNYIKSSLEYLDDNGSQISFRTSEHITKIKRKNQSIASNFEVQGEILEYDHINCQIEKVNTHKLKVHHDLRMENLANDGEYYSDYSLVFVDGFKKDVEWWILGVKSYCVLHEFQVIIPSNRKLLKSQLFHKIVANDEEKKLIFQDRDKESWPEYDRSKKLVVKHHNSTVISVQITGMTPHDLFMITWNLS